MAEVYITSRAKLFLLFLCKNQTQLAQNPTQGVICGVDIDRITMGIMTMEIFAALQRFQANLRLQLWSSLKPNQARQRCCRSCLPGDPPHPPFFFFFLNVIINSLLFFKKKTKTKKLLELPTSICH